MDTTCCFCAGPTAHAYAMGVYHYARSMYLAAKAQKLGHAAAHQPYLHLAESERWQLEVLFKMPHILLAVLDDSPLMNMRMKLHCMSCLYIVCALAISGKSSACATRFISCI